MGTVSQLHERVRQPAHRIQSEEEALDIARSLAAAFAQQASDRDINRVLPYDEIEMLSQSGLLGISVPSEHGGIDISNSVLTEVVAVLAEADPPSRRSRRRIFMCWRPCGSVAARNRKHPISKGPSSATDSAACFRRLAPMEPIKTISG